MKPAGRRVAVCVMITAIGVASFCLRWVFLSTGLLGEIVLVAAWLMAVGGVQLTFVTALSGVIDGDAAMVVGNPES